MKPKKIKKLTLKKVTVSDLNNSAMRHLYGGGSDEPACQPTFQAPTICHTLCVTNCPECLPNPSWQGC